MASWAQPALQRDVLAQLATGPLHVIAHAHGQAGQLLVDLVVVSGAVIGTSASPR
ncbi:hypothetical protein [Kribbella voronezhensis]|uniref:hypothetical protein n=1 Tax=Kribbella voronezhensis TaxID=2512212 RepID=UPI001417075B|nr:hypothetical protein [Kribbella voronezhensis]